MQQLLFNLSDNSQKARGTGLFVLSPVTDRASTHRLRMLSDVGEEINAMDSNSKDICDVYTPRFPDVDEKAKDLAIDLLAGQARFFQRKDDYLKQVHAGPDAGAKEVELAIMLHCSDPYDVHAGTVKTPQGDKFQYEIDGWRIKVNEAVGSIANSQVQELPDTLQRVQKDVNGIPKSDYDVFIAWFNKIGESLSTPFPFRAQKGPNGEIEISQKLAQK